MHRMRVSGFPLRATVGFGTGSGAIVLCAVVPPRPCRGYLRGATPLPFDRRSARR
jgi:hypothetical protein